MKRLILLGMLLSLIVLAGSENGLVTKDFSGEYHIPPRECIEIRFAFENTDVTMVVIASPYVDIVLFPDVLYSRWKNNNTYEPEMCWRRVSEWNETFTFTDYFTGYIILENYRYTTPKEASIQIFVGDPTFDLSSNDTIEDPSIDDSTVLTTEQTAAVVAISATTATIVVVAKKFTEV